ncbi:transaldolase [Brochothrix thermosphacta]|uniref:Transaldolase n=1 Tax=Brochothrix thermosphacta TaxID=2756 RepID=A0A291KJ20_BROTH|nr:transaldolase [Brochothrix thermosphacta]ATF27086.1 transaldolase [Brochothrix thermosphacta]ATH86445.1 transaldolase [Brochothrix thermosphacta]MPQ28023.1 transaldolase [Brochothrix thermosphacta]
MIEGIKVFADGAELDKMVASYKAGEVSGFTTNPSLMKKAGITDYNEFAKAAVTAIPDMPLSFEVFADDFETMEKEARKIATFGDNVFVKIPITNTKGESSIPLIKKLSSEGVSLNVTALLTLEQVQDTVDALTPGTNNIVSVFAGRVADTGVDPTELMVKSLEICKQKPGAELLWASTRELINIIQAKDIGVDIITVPPAIIGKIKDIGKDLNQVSLDTVIGFNNDIQALGYSIL